MSLLKENFMSSFIRSDYGIAFSIIFAGFMLGIGTWFVTSKGVISFSSSEKKTSKIMQASCFDKKNINTPYCIERRHQLQADWNTISRNYEGQANAFHLSDRLNEGSKGGIGLKVSE